MGYFRSVYQKLVEYDGNLLRRKAFGGDELVSADGAHSGQTDEQVATHTDAKSDRWLSYGRYRAKLDTFSINVKR